MTETIVSSLIGSSSTVIVALIAIMSNNAVIKFKIEELEKNIQTGV